METEQRRSNFINYMSNPRSFTLKKWFAELLKEDYSPHDQIIERMSTSITTEKDLKDLGKLIMKLYEKAYLKAVDDYKEQAENMGIKISVITSKDSISGNSE